MNTKQKQPSAQNQLNPVPQNPPAVKPTENPNNSGVLTLIQLLLFVTAIAAIAMFLTLISAKFEFAYVKTSAPSVCATTHGMESSGNIYESELPKPAVYEVILPDYDFSQPVPESPAYPPEHFSNAVFIGDSRTVGMIMYTKLNTIDYSQVGLNIGLLSNKNYIRHTDEKGDKEDITCMKALEVENGNYSAIYLALGINELGWDANSFIKAYRNALIEIRKFTDVPIYIQLIIPVTSAYSENSTFGITNEKAVIFNELLTSLAEEMEVFLLDPRELFALEDGTLNPEYSSDGVHLSIAAYKTLLAFYQSHIVEAENYKNLRSIEITE